MAIEAAPAEVLVQQLADARARGERFSEAWPDALKAALSGSLTPRSRHDWRVVLVELEDTFAAAFERRHTASGPERALRRLRDELTPEHEHCA